MLIDSFEALKILEAYQQGKKSVEINFDLGFTKKIITLKKNNVLIDANTYTIAEIKKIVKNHAVYILEKKAKKVAFFDQNYYKLEPIENSAPTIEIDGIRMHRTKNIKPLEDAKRKIDQVKIRQDDNVLDICTGLGYTAIESYKRNANITTIEKDVNVIEVAKYNPYSVNLFEGINNGKIKLIIDNGADAVQNFEKETFDAILHDPPRFSLAGELYSEEFYGHLYRILKTKGRLLHYVGNPSSKYRKKDFVKGVLNRLLNVGFKVRKTEDGESILANKK